MTVYDRGAGADGIGVDGPGADGSGADGLGADGSGADGLGADGLGADGATNALFLNVVPMPQSLALSWSPPDRVVVDPVVYEVRWRARVPGWREYTKLVVGKRNLTLTNLVDGQAYDVKVSVVGGVEASPVATATPAQRKQCSYGHVAVYCDTRDLERLITDKGWQPSDLYCRNQPLTEWNRQVPNCYYTLIDGSPAFKLLRNLGQDFRETPRRAVGAIRRILRRVLWPVENPFDHSKAFPHRWLSMAKVNVGGVSKHSAVESLRLDYSPWFSSRVTWFAPKTRSPRGVVLFHHGHACANTCTGTRVGSRTIDWWLDEGWYVMHVDMPAHGINYEDAPPDQKSFLMHDMNFIDIGRESPAWVFVLPLKHIVDEITRRAQLLSLPPAVVMMGRSGGGWSTVFYAALDQRIDVAIPVAGWLPMSMRARPNLENPNDWPRNMGDYEQMLPHIYDAVTYVDLFRAAGRLGILSIFNRMDSCCFRLEPTDPFIAFVEAPDPMLAKKVSRIWVDENNTHSTSPEALKAMGQFLDQLGL